jgi:ElaB/YqjD/DUF883 family membrane-anchored ribosome-binding protein
MSTKKTTDTTSSTVSDSLESSRTHAVKAAEELKAAARQKAEELKGSALEKAAELRGKAEETAKHFRDSANENADHFRNYADESWSDIKVRLDDYKEEGERYIRQNPTKSILLAVGLGFIIGRILR